MLKVDRGNLHQNLSKSSDKKFFSIQAILDFFFSNSFFEEKKNPEKLIEQINSFLPFISWTLPTSTPGTVSIILLTHKHKQEPSAFFSYATRNLLIPGKELSFILTRTQQFRFENDNKKEFIFHENVIRLETEEDLFTIQKNLPCISIHLRKSTGFYGEAFQLMHNRANNTSMKLDLIMKGLYFLHNKHNHLFNEDLFIHLQQFMSFVDPAFLEPRSARYLLRVFTTTYLFTKNINQSLVSLPQLHHIKLRLLQTNLRFPIGERKVLGILTTINLHNEREIILPTHLFKAAKSIYSKIRLVPESEFILSSDLTKAIYIEIEKKNHEPFTKKELNNLKKWLPDEIALHIEKTTHAIFAPENEEEVFQKAITLSKMLKNASDPSKLLLKFNRQTADELIFQAIIVRPIHLEDPPFSQLLQDVKKNFLIAFDQVKVMGNIDDEFVKEANIIRIRIKKELFLREDNSVHLMQATQSICEKLVQAIGKVDDLTFKEDNDLKNLFSALTKSLKPQSKTTQFRLENFFYSFSKEQLDKIKKTSCLKETAKLLLKADYNMHGVDCFIQKKQTAEYLCLLIQTEYETIQEELQNHLRLIELPTNSITLAKHMIHGIQYLALIYQEKNSEKQQLLIEVIQTSIKELRKKNEKNQILRLGVNLTTTFLLNPTSAFDHNSEVVFHLIYDGLMRYNHLHKLEYGVAQKVELSKNLKSYRFFLKKTKWSNGTPLTAYDFANSWKKMIDPDNQILQASMFYIIKNAKKAYERKVSLDKVGITVENNYTLTVELEYPNPHFLEYIATFSYFPFFQKTVNGTLPISNGPFRLNTIREKEFLKLVKNEYYHDFLKVRLKHIHIQILENVQRLTTLFNQNEVDWAGKPMMLLLQKEKEHYKSKNILKSHTSNGMLLLKMNHGIVPFNNKKIRNSLSLCLNRNYITKQLTKGNQPVAKSILPFSLSLNGKNLIEDNQIEKAKILFQEGLEELNIKKEELSPISLLHPYTPDYRKIASYIQNSWKKHLDFSIDVLSLDWAEICEKLPNRSYEIMLVNDYLLTNDPIEYFNDFSSTNLNMNNSSFYHPDFINLLNKTIKEERLEKKQALLAETERLLVDQMPSIPIYEPLDLYVKKEYLKGECLLPDGNVDFKEAYIEK